MGASSRSGEGITAVFEQAGSPDGSIIASKVFMLLEHTQKIEVRKIFVRTRGPVKSRCISPSPEGATPLGETVGCGKPAKVDGTTPLGKPLGGSRLMAEPDGNNPSIMWESAAEHLSALLRSLLVPVQRSLGCRSAVMDHSSGAGLRYDLTASETAWVN